MKNKIITIILSLFMLVSTAKASNEHPKIKSEIAKDHSLNFNLEISEIKIDKSKEYEWQIFKNEKQDCSSKTFYKLSEENINDEGTIIELLLQFNSDARIKEIIRGNEKAYLAIKEKGTNTCIIGGTNSEISLEIPYEYGPIPEYLRSLTNENPVWKMNPSTLIIPEKEVYLDNVKITAVKIEDKNLIDRYNTIKSSLNGRITDNEITRILNETNLKLPNEFAYTKKSMIGEDFYTGQTNEAININEPGLYYVWGCVSRKKSREICGVTIHDTTSPIIKEMEYKEKKEDNTKKIAIMSFLVLAILIIVFIIFKRKNKKK